MLDFSVILLIFTSSIVECAIFFIRVEYLS